MTPIILNRFVLIPAYVLTVITAIRTPLQIMAPDHAMTPYFSSVAPMFVLLLLYPILLQRKGLSFFEFLKVQALMILLVRIPVAAAYAMAFMFRWTEPSGEPVRYIRDFSEFDGVITTLPATLIALFAPLITGTLIGALIWTITWASAYRGDRTWSGAALPK